MSKHSRRRFLQFGIGAAASLLIPEFVPRVWALDQTMIQERPLIHRSWMEPGEGLVLEDVVFPVGEPWTASEMVTWRVKSSYFGKDGALIINDAELVNERFPIRYDIRAVIL